TLVEMAALIELRGVPFNVVKMTPIVEFSRYQPVTSVSRNVLPSGIASFSSAFSFPSRRTRRKFAPVRSDRLRSRQSSRLNEASTAITEGFIFKTNIDWTTQSQLETQATQSKRD